MKISNYELVHQAESHFVKNESKRVQIEVFKVNPQNQMPPVALSLSENAAAGGVEGPEELFHLSEEDLEKIRLLEQLISALTGKEFKFNQVVKLQQRKQRHQAPSVNGSAENTNQRQFGLRITTSHEIHEKEKMQYTSKGVVKTEDGRTIAFDLNLNMKRSFYEKRDSVLQIGGQMQDPLVINLDGKGVAFGEDTLSLDLTLDGNPEIFRSLASGSGFLARDTNGNGTIDDGSELFGPSTGHGFSELATYDEDGNNWIDETDEIFKELKIWQVNPQGVKTLIGIKEAGVGAIFIGHVSSQYQIKEGSELLAKIRETGTYLKENGVAGVIHEIDLKV